jgi:hypothetical protein
MEWASPRMCVSKSTFLKGMRFRIADDALRVIHQPLKYQNELLVLVCFTDTLENGQLSVGLIFTSRRLFCTISQTILGQSSEVLMAKNGTYKLHFGGWTLVSFGTYGVRYTATHQYQRSFTRLRSCSFGPRPRTHTPDCLQLLGIVPRNVLEEPWTSSLNQWITPRKLQMLSGRCGQTLSC